MKESINSKALAIAAALVLMFCLFMWWRSGPRNGQVSSYKFDRARAYVVAQKAMEGKIRSFSPASFPPLSDPQVRCEWDGQRAMVVAHVEAKSPFGVMISERWRADVDWNQNTDEYTCTKVEYF